MDVNVKGEYAEAIIHAADDSGIAVDQYAMAQIQMLCNCEVFEGAKIRIMPDVHAGKIGPIGLTVSYRENSISGVEVPLCTNVPHIEKIMPGIIGNDIGCGVSYVRFKPKKQPDFARLDRFIRSEIAPRSKRVDEDGVGSVMKSIGLEPTGRSSYQFSGMTTAMYDCLFVLSGKFQADRAAATFGTLGGGNHFIEVGMGEDGAYWLIVHSGSRNLGNQVYEYYMDQGRKELKRRSLEIPYEMTWLDGNLKDAYILDSYRACDFAEQSRLRIIESIMKHMKWKPYSACGDTYDAIKSCTHNYIDCKTIRKGAISAEAGEDVVIPINMRDGVILGKGKGNPEWNYSAPHGSGRLLKRSDVSSNHTVSEFKKEMKGVWTSCVNKETLDEAPFAYRGIDQFEDALTETIEIVDVVKPLYSFKGHGGAK